MGANSIDDRHEGAFLTGFIAAIHRQLLSEADVKRSPELSDTSHGGRFGIHFD